MKRFWMIAIFAIMGINMQAQDDRLDDFTFDTEPIQRESIPYFAVAGGAIVGFHFPDYAELNNQLKAANFNVPEFSGLIPMWGAQGFTGTVFVPNLRIGFFGMGGTSTVSAPVTGEGSSSTRYVDYSISQSGISLDYALVPFKSFAILPGVSIGRGNLSIESYQTAQGIEWNDFTPIPSKPTNLTRLENGYWFVKPELYLEYALTNFLMFRASAGYNFVFGSKWTMNNESEVSNVPDKLNSPGPQLQVGLFLGLFNY